MGFNSGFKGLTKVSVHIYIPLQVFIPPELNNYHQLL